MPVTAQTFEEVLESIENALFLEGSALSDFNQGSRLRVLSRASARVLSEVWRNFSELARDSNVATAVGDALELLTNTLGVTRKPGEQAMGSMIVRALSPSASGVIRDGDIVTFSGANFTVSLGLTGSLALSYPTTIVPITAVPVGDRWNLPANTPLTFAREDLLPSFTAVVGTGFDIRGLAIGALTNGEDRETDTQLRTRFANYMQSLTRATFLAVTTALASIRGLQAINVIEYVPAIGWFTVFVDDGSANPLLDDTKKQEIEDVLFRWRAAGVGVRIQTQEKVVEDVELRVKIERTQIPADMEAAVTDALVQALGDFGLGQILYPTKLIDIAHGVPGVLSVEVLLPTAPVDLFEYQVFRPKSVTVHAVL